VIAASSIVRLQKRYAAFTVLADVELDEPVAVMVAEGVSPNIMLDKVIMRAWSKENIPGSPTQTLVLRQRLLHLEPVAGFK
jgi:hypothetical protein